MQTSLYSNALGSTKFRPGLTYPPEELVRAGARTRSENFARDGKGLLIIKENKADRNEKTGMYIRGT